MVEERLLRSRSTVKAMIEKIILCSWSTVLICGWEITLIVSKYSLIVPAVAVEDDSSEVADICFFQQALRCRRKKICSHVFSCVWTAWRPSHLWWKSKSMGFYNKSFPRVGSKKFTLVKYFIWWCWFITNRHYDLNGVNCIEDFFLIVCKYCLLCGRK